MWLHADLVTRYDLQGVRKNSQTVYSTTWEGEASEDSKDTGAEKDGARKILGKDQGYDGRRNGAH